MRQHGLVIVTVLVAGGLVVGCSASPTGPAGVSAGSSTAANGGVAASGAATVAPTEADGANAGPETTGPETTGPEASGPGTAPASPVAAPPGVGTVPARVSIPAIGLDEQLIDLGLQADGTMEVPADFSRVGWYTGGGRPGGIGPTVIAGHIDSAVGPAVFFRLDELAVGDTFEVRAADGTPFVYRVYEIGDYAKAEFPTARVFGATAMDEVRLITCSGTFDRAVGHYEDNLVVFAGRAG